MKNVAILTFPNANNYGALLQTYALKQAFGKQGHAAKIINYHSPKYEAKAHLFTQIKFNRRWVKQVLNLPSQWYIRARFTAFRNQYLQDMAPVFYDTLPTLSNQYDLFVTGSDQVFNPRIIWNDDRFFLSFCTDKKKAASYAASFGLGLESFTEEEKSFIKTSLSHLAHISVREQEGKEIVQTLAPGREVEVNLDPALLLTKADWEKIAKRPAVKQPYCLVYLLMYRDESFLRYIRKFAKERNLKIVIISSKFNLTDWLRGMHKAPTVAEWLGLFLNAQYVFTNSFHGLAFSVNFNKPFMVGPLNPKWPTASRLNNLLDITGLQHRKFNGASSVFREKEDWDSVNKKLEEQRQKAFDYLKRITE